MSWTCCHYIFISPQTDFLTCSTGSYASGVRHELGWFLKGPNEIRLDRSFCGSESGLHKINWESNTRENEREGTAEAQGRGSIYHHCTRGRSQPGLLECGIHDGESSWLCRALQEVWTSSPRRGVRPVLRGERFSPHPSPLPQDPISACPRRKQPHSTTFRNHSQVKTKAEPQLPAACVPSSQPVTRLGQISARQHRKPAASSQQKPAHFHLQAGPLDGRTFPGPREQVSFTVALLISVQI